MEKVYRALSADADMENLSIDSASVKVHQSANGGKKGRDQRLGLSCGGLNIKFYAVVDGLGKPVEFLLSPGNDHDSVHAIKLLSAINFKGIMIWEIKLTVQKQSGAISLNATQSM